MHIREAKKSDISALSKIRAGTTELEEYWAKRIRGYMDGEMNPQKALPPRIIYAAVEANNIIGFIAGHCTVRYACDGELQWIDVVVKFQGKGVGKALVKTLAAWFINNNSCKVCVDVGSEAGKNLYTALGAKYINEHWMIWNDISELL